MELEVFPMTLIYVGLIGQEVVGTGSGQRGNVFRSPRLGAKLVLLLILKLSGQYNQDRMKHSSHLK